MYEFSPLYRVCRYRTIRLKGYDPKSEGYYKIFPLFDLR